MVDDPSFSLQTAGINIQSPDKCFRMNVNVKPLDGGSRSVLCASLCRGQ